MSYWGYVTKVFNYDLNHKNLHKFRPNDKQTKNYLTEQKTDKQIFKRKFFVNYRKRFFLRER